MTSREVASPSPIAAGLRGRCPRCGQGALFRGALTLDINPACDRCGLDFRFIDSGDGPAVFAIFVLGTVVLGSALFIEAQFAPPFWVHVVLWGPVTLGLAFGMLKPMKALMIAQQYRHKAGAAGMAPARDAAPGAGPPAGGRDRG